MIMYYNYIKKDGSDLEVQYSPSCWSKRFNREQVIKAHINTINSDSEKTRLSHPHIEVSYGPTERQCFDIFSSNHLPTDAPVILYIHGGYWQTAEMCRQNSCFMVPPLSEAGFVVVVLGYDLAPMVSMAKMLHQVTIGVVNVLQWAENRGSRGVYLMGHSAGAHLAAMVLTESLQDLRYHLIKGEILLSGIYDLQPLLTTSVNNALKFTEESAWSHSPLRQMENLVTNCAHHEMSLLIVTAENDSPAFQEQSLTFHKELQQRRIDSQYLQVPFVDHFNLVENLADPHSFVTKHQDCFQKVIQWLDRESKTESRASNPSTATTHDKDI